MTTSFYIIAVYNSVNYCILFVTRETFNMNKFYLDVDSIIEYKIKNIYFLGLLRILANYYLVDFICIIYHTYIIFRINKKI